MLRLTSQNLHVRLFSRELAILTQITASRRYLVTYFK